jgi:PAS domain S-box-containing protein
MEEPLEEQSALFDKLQDAILIQNLEGKIIFWNKGAERLYGWAKVEAVGNNCNKLLYKEASSQNESAQRIVLEKGEWLGELNQVARDGREIVVKSYWTLLRGEKEPELILAFNTDIVERRKLVYQFLRAQRVESIGNLASGIAHDLNNVLAPILMSIQLLRKKFVDERSQRVLSTLEESAQRGADMVKQVLSFARGIEGERVVLQLKHLICDLETILNQTFSKSIKIEISILKDLWTVAADATQIYQVLMNLCVNARDAMPHGGKLSIEARNVILDKNYASMDIEARPGRFVLITVTDTGMGMPPGIVEKIFEPFFTTKEHGSGTGLGLSTALRIVKIHGGFINVYSELGKGTVFKIYFPALESEHIKQAEAERQELPSGHDELVLIVDDEAAIRGITKATLEAYGYNVITASDGTEALALYAEHKDKVSVVITDMIMPYMDGPMTIRALQKLDPKVKIIAASGLTTNDKIAEDASTNVKAFLPKPYTAEKLLETVAEVLSKD